MTGHELKGPNQRAQPGDSPLEAFSGSAALGGAAKGASMGMALGPWGAAIGGAIGGISAGIKGGKAQEEAEALAKVQQMEEVEKDKALAKLAVERKGKSDGWRGFSGSEGGMTDQEADQLSA